jgi:hypothetical protein
LIVEASASAAVPAWVIERAEIRTFINDTIGDYLSRRR